MDNDRDRFHEEVQEALELLEFAVSQGFTSEDGRKVSDGLIEAINQAEDRARSEEPPPAEERATFEQAYRDLSLLLAPVTVQTLRATSETYGERSAVSPWRKVSKAAIWSRTLWGWTFLLIAVALLGEVLDELLDPLPENEAAGSWPSFWYLLNTVLQVLAPFTYGGLGAVAYLLRSAHGYIYKRQFNPLRKPEYYNRMLLGIVSGGAITLFVSQLTTDQDQVIHLGAAALGFIAGYNTEFLFSAIERITAAILPRVGPETVRRATRSTSGTMSVSGVSLQDLLNRYQSAQTDEEKKLYLGLIERLKDRL